jgi:hypothetical protein
MSIVVEQANIFAEIQGYLISSALELFEAYGVRVEHEPRGMLDTTPRSVMATIGFAAEGLRGALVLVSTHEVVASLQPEVLRATDAPQEIVLRDVFGEFSNMLLGRLKNKLLPRGVAALLATPTTMMGERLPVPVPYSGLSAWHRFSGGVGDIFVRLDATMDPQLILESPPMPDAGPPLAEGEMLLF